MSIRRKTLRLVEDGSSLCSFESWTSWFGSIMVHSCSYARININVEIIFSNEHLFMFIQLPDNSDHYDIFKNA